MEYEIVPVPTRILTSRDDIVEAVKEYGKGKFGPDDVICTAESVVAITQGMAKRCEEFKPGFLAKLLCHFFPSYGSIVGLYCGGFYQITGEKRCILPDGGLSGTADR